MRIISDFHDYYDGLMRTDEDRATLYLRKSESIETSGSKWPFPEWKRPYCNKDVVTGKIHIIGFCGKVYPVIELTYTSYKGLLILHTVLCLDAAGVDSFYRRLPKADKKDYFSEAPGGKRKWRKEYMARFTVRTFFDECKAQQDEFKNMFVVKQCPIFVASKELGLGNKENHMTWNANLGNLGFVHVLDPATAYQELSMWMDNQAIPFKPEKPIDDVTMAEIKGFDKYSFRKEPTKRKGK